MRKLSLKELNRPTLEEYLDSPKQSVTIVLDNIRSGMNVGSIFRTADAFALEKIFLCGITPKPPHREILKTSIGATESVKWEYFEDCKVAVQRLIEQDYTIFLVEQTTKSEMLQDVVFPVNKPVAFVFGNEVHGISDEVVNMFDQSIELPQFGTKHSFNIAVCAGIVLWSYWSQATKVQ
jgi:tRNA G18 (ribose-2'-O)-methylase SpoU